MAVAPPGPTPTRRPPGPPAGWIARQLLTSPDLLGVLETTHVRYGDVVGWRMGGKRFVAIGLPDHLEQVLVAGHDRYRKSVHYRILAVGTGEGLLISEGDAWAHQRHLIQPLLGRRQLGRLAELMTPAVTEFADRWDAAPAGEPVDMAAGMTELTLDVVGRALFGTPLTGTAERLGPAVLVGLHTGVAAARLQLVAPVPRWLVDVLGGLVSRYPLPGLGRIHRALATIDDVVHELIALREARPDSDPGDLLGLLLNARDDSGQPMSRQQVRDELVTFLLAGHETTANGLAWTWYLLSRNPEARDRLHAEVDELLADRVPCADDAERLVWTTACFQEAIRLYPPAWVLEREAVRADEIGGYRVDPGTTVIMPIYMTQRDPRWWPDPERFDPARFLPGQTHPRGAYLPFGAGRRVCVGATFATMEATLILAMLAQRFLFDCVPGAEVRPVPTITLRPLHGLPVVRHRRVPTG